MNQMTIQKFQDYGIKLLYVFFFGMIWQFLAHTIVMYGLKLPTNFEFIRLRKEVIIGILGLGSLYFLWKNKYYREILLKNKNIIMIIVFIILSFTISFLNSTIIHNQSIITFLVSAKFNYIPLIILSSGLLFSQFINQDQYNKIINYVIITIKYVLVFSLLRYVIIHTIPNILDWIGFAQPGDSIEWTANTPPPSLYLTEFYSGYVRNQGPFGGPLSLGFYLVVLWPLFFAKVLYKKDISKVWGRRLLYISIVISTYSRAAWGMFFISSIIIALIIYRKYTKYIITSGLLAILGIYIYIKSGGQSEMFLRTWSDKGHLEFFKQGLELVKSNRLRGLGSASVGPGSNHIDGIKDVFNPENQYMQIRLEYGLFGLIGRLSSYFIIIKKSLYKLLNLWRSDVNYDSNDVIFIGISISIIVLGIGGMVLHPFTDSSSMYPFMLVSGIVLGFNKTNSIEKQPLLISEEKLFGFGWKIRSIFITFLFTIQTLLVSGFKIFENTVILSSIRDIIFGGAVLGSIILYKKYIMGFFKRYYGIIVLSIILFTINGLFLLSNIHQDVVHVIAGIKYDIYFIIILLFGLRVGYIIQKEKKGEYINQHIKRFGKFIIIVILGGMIWQIFKNIYPNMFIEYLGFSSPSDFIPFTKPPIYYITGSGGIQRLSGFFVGPNTFGFFLILFSSIIYYLYKEYIKRNIRIIFLYIIICIITFSRGVIIGLTLQTIIIILFEDYIINKTKKISILNVIKKNITILIATISISILSFFLINQWKQDSNQERFGALNTSIELLSKISLIGNGAGFVGPAKHYDENYNLERKNNLSMLENIYLQIIINQGIIGFILFIGIIINLIIYHNYIRKNIYLREKQEIPIIAQYLGIGLISLLGIGRFLHIFIDSMVNYLFFIVYGISIGYSYKNTIQ